MIHKRGVSSDLFVWMFALIAGALLLFFFITWSQRHAATSTTVEDIEFLRSLEQQISALSTTDELSKTLTFPRPFQLHIDCDTFFTDQASETSSLFLFSPSSLTGQRYSLVGLPWRFPFYIDMFYYLIPQGSLVLLFYEPSATAFVTSLDLPSTMPVKALPSSAFSLTTLKKELQGYSRVTLVFFGRAPDASTLLAALKPLPVTLLEVDLQRSLLTFFPSGQQQPYYNEAHLVGAWFGPEQYSCLSKHALERFRLLTSLYQHKVVSLQQKLGSGSSCQQLLSQAQSLLSSLPTVPADQLHASVASLQSLNEDLERHDCPTIY